MMVAFNKLLPVAASSQYSKVYKPLTWPKTALERSVLWSNR